MTSPRLQGLGSEANLPAPEPVATTLYYLRAMREMQAKGGEETRGVSLG